MELKRPTLQGFTQALEDGVVGLGSQATAAYLGADPLSALGIGIAVATTTDLSRHLINKKAGDVLERFGFEAVRAAVAWGPATVGAGRFMNALLPDPLYTSDPEFAAIVGGIVVGVTALARGLQEVRNMQKQVQGNR